MDEEDEDGGGTVGCYTTVQYATVYCTAKGLFKLCVNLPVDITIFQYVMIRFNPIYYNLK